jgi:hypothetical protein
MSYVYMYAFKAPINRPLDLNLPGNFTRASAVIGMIRTFGLVIHEERATVSETCRSLMVVGVHSNSKLENLGLLLEKSTPKAGTM